MLSLASFIASGSGGCLVIVREVSEFCRMQAGVERALQDAVWVQHGRLQEWYRRARGH